MQTIPLPTEPTGPLILFMGDCFRELMDEYKHVQDFWQKDEAPSVQVLYTALAEFIYRMHLLCGSSSYEKAE